MQRAAVEQFRLQSQPFAFKKIQDKIRHMVASIVNSKFQLEGRRFFKFVVSAPSKLEVATEETAAASDESQRYQEEGQSFDCDELLKGVLEILKL